VAFAGLRREWRFHNGGLMAGEPVGSAAVLEQLERMLGSTTFRGAERSSSLLRFVVEQTVQGHAERLKDYTLGAEVLKRGELFDPRTDPIARVEASRLRSRLDLYYATEGAADPVLISLPKGGYVPQFEARGPATGGVGPMTRAAPPRLWWAATLVGIPVAFALGLATRGRPPDPPAAPELRLEIATPPTTDPVSVALSPDGRSIVFVASTDGVSRLWLRSLDSTSATPLANTEYASLPFWSPDGRAIGFFADLRLKRLDLHSGLVRDLARALVPAGASWNRDGDILHPGVPDGPLYRTGADGSGRVLETALAPGQTGHRAPFFLPDQRHFVFYVMGSAAVRGIYLGELGSTTVVRLVDADAPAVFAPPAHLLYVSQRTLFAHALDLQRRAIAGEPVAIAEGIAISAEAGIPALTASPAGAIAFRAGDAGGRRQFVWFDRHGRELSRVGAAESAGPSYAAISPDRRRLAVQRTTAGNTDIWLIDLERSTSVRLTSEAQADICPIWSPNGDRVVYSSIRGGTFQLVERAIADASSTDVLTTPLSKQATDWSRDGRWLLFRSIAGVGAELDVWALPLSGDRTPVPVAATQFEERDAQFSPQARWIAYQSNESGRNEIYVQPFQHHGDKVRISTGGGAQARWRADGRELFYLTLDGRLMATPITFGLDEATMSAGTPVPLFRARVGAVQDRSTQHYVVSPDGQRFLLDTVVEEAVPPVTIVLNWQPAR
jgi:Tol biopolymer transport system component